MADKPEEGGGDKTTEIVILSILIIGIAMVWGWFAYFDAAVNYINNFTAPTLVGDAKKIIGFLNGLAIPVSLMLLIGIIFCIEGLKTIRRKEEDAFNAHAEAAYRDAVAAEANEGDPGLTIRWRKIIELVDSTNQNDWRQAILDADTIMDEILQKGGYIGDSLGERLTNANKADFQTIDQAWEAHKVRNMIAHDGSSFLLSQHEAKRIVNLYKQVFEEFYFV